MLYVKVSISPATFWRPLTSIRSWSFNFSGLLSTQASLEILNELLLSDGVG